jgi:DNA polymerase-1
MNLAFRNFHAFEKMGLKTSDGIPTGTLFGMASFIVNLVKNEQPDYIAVAMESDECFRKEILSSYKENRQGKPSEFEEYLPHVIQMFHVLGIPLFKFRGMEADDVIGILTSQFKKDAEIFIVSGDKDFMQLVDDNVKLYMPKSKGLYKTAGKEEVFEKFGCRPDQVVDVLALMGDKVDCIPGVQGVGPKGAAKLISQFGSLKNMYADSEALRKSVSAKQFEKLDNGKSDAFTSYELATIVQNINIDMTLDTIAFNNENIKSQQFLDFCDTYELTSIKNKIFVDLNGIE